MTDAGMSSSELNPNRGPEAQPAFSAAVIVAGERAGDTVAGLGNLDRAVLTALEIGIPRFLIVTGEPEHARRLLRPTSLGRATIVCARSASAEFYRFRDSLEAGPEPFLLLHTDIVFDVTLLRDLAAAARRQSGAPIFAVAGTEGTREIESVDQPGLACVPPDGASCLGDGTLNIGDLHAALKRRFQGRVLPERSFSGLATTVRTEAGRRAAERGLLRGMAKAGDGLVARYINRPISTAISSLVIGTGVTPNMISAGVLVLGVAAAATLSLGHHWSFVLGALLYQSASILDGCDGEIARAKFLASPHGEWIDRIADSIGNILVAIAIPIGLYRLTGSPLHLWLGRYLIVLAVITPALHYAGTRAEHYHHSTGILLQRLRADSPVTRFLALVTRFYSRDVLILVCLLLALLGLEAGILYLLVFGVTAYNLVLLARFRRPVTEWPPEAAPASNGPS